VSPTRHAWKCCLNPSFTENTLLIEPLSIVAKAWEQIDRIGAWAYIRFDYGDVIPWVVPCDGGIRAIAGPDMLWLETSVPLATTNEKSVSRFTVRPGQTDRFVLMWHPSHQTVINPIEPKRALAAAEEWWQAWSGLCAYVGPWQEVVVRSLITLKALTYAPTGGIVAAPTTSLPECPGGQRNWDYRYCWLRDATFTLYALTLAGYIEEAKQWSQWLLRAVAGEPKQMQTLYGVAGERRLEEITLDWLSGYEGSKPVRVGNAAYRQFQLDIYGEIMDALHLARRAGLKPREAGWQLQRTLLAFVESVWDSPDEGIWEVRGPRRHFTYSKVMAWVALDRALRACEQFGLEGPVERWQALCERIHRDVCEKGFDARRGSFVQYYGGKGWMRACF
jgi:GH15 family glucan-1,4-alpha-glucosidase